MLHDDFFVGDAPVEKEVELQNGTKHVLYFRQLSAAEFRKLYENKGKDFTATMIARCLCNPDGSDAITLEQAAKLKPKAEQAIVAAINAVIGIKEEAGNP
jgi:hypothetical protein